MIVDDLISIIMWFIYSYNPLLHKIIRKVKAIFIMIMIVAFLCVANLLVDIQ